MGAGDDRACGRGVRSRMVQFCKHFKWMGTVLLSPGGAGAAAGAAAGA